MIKINLKDAYQLIFWEESKNQIESIEREMLAVEAHNYNEETLHVIFRMAHSLKGSAATMEIMEIMRVAHVLEDLLTLIKNDHMPLNQANMTVIFEAIDVLKWLHELLTLDSANQVSKIEESVTGVEKRIKSLLLCPEAPAVPVAHESYTPIQGAVQLCIAFEESAEMLSVKAYMIVHALSQIGTILKTVPYNYETCNDADFNRVFKVVLHTNQSPKEMIEALQYISELKEVTVLDNGLEAEKPINTEVSKPLSIDITSVRISTEKINQLINLVGELTLNKEVLFDVTKTLKKTYKKDKQIVRLEDACEGLQYLSSELQDILLNARLIPLDVVFSKFPRMVRDLALASDKAIKLEITGSEQGVDRGIIEELADPLMHLIRNAVDHGIESKEHRIKIGKSPEGHLKISAWQGDNQVVIAIEDDGFGIDLDKIRVKALTKQLISIEEAVHLTESEWLEYIFRPGFSTTNEVTTLSGRGVGLDVVKSNISKINGHIDLKTTLGQGTKFTIQLPLTMSIMNVLLIKEDNCIFGIPTSQIVEIIRITEDAFSDKIYATEYSEVLNWQDTTLPMVSLSKVFLLKPPCQSKKRLVVVLGTGERKIALEVNQILGEQEVVIKSMRDFIGKGKIFGELHEISGVSVLGNGSLAQIIDGAMFYKN